MSAYETLVDTKLKFYHANYPLDRIIYQKRSIFMPYYMMFAKEIHNIFDVKYRYMMSEIIFVYYTINYAHSSNRLIKRNY